MATGAFLAGVVKLSVAPTILKSVLCETDALGIPVRFTCCPVTIRR